MNSSLFCVCVFGQNQPLREYELESWFDLENPQIFAERGRQKSIGSDAFPTPPSTVATTCVLGTSIDYLIPPPTCVMYSPLSTICVVCVCVCVCA